MNYYDQEGIREYARSLSSSFSAIEASFDAINEYFNKATDNSMWNAPSSIHFIDKKRKLREETNKLTNKFMNVSNYLEQVAENVDKTEAIQAEAFTSRFS